jgi:two-component sensor histidine kinase
MWTISKHSRQMALAHSQLESVLLQRTAELQSLSLRLLKVQDEEKRKLSRDLHDSTGQTLAALKISVSFLQKNYKQDESAMAIISEVAELADQAIAEIRTMSYLLHPPLLDEVGFACAAECYVEGFAKRSGVTVGLDIATDRERLPISIEVALFRVLQESLTNVHRHSGASEVSVCFRHQLSKVILEIRDNGTGIPAERLKKLREGNAETGVGLAGMRERLHELNGKLEIESVGHGTTMLAIVPHVAISRSGRPGDSWEGTTPSTLRGKHQLPNCCVCHIPVLLETSTTNEYGQAVHEDCYAFKLCRKAEPLNDGAFMLGADGGATRQRCEAPTAADCDSLMPEQSDLPATILMQPAKIAAWYTRPGNRVVATVVTVFVLSCWVAYSSRHTASLSGTFEVQRQIGMAEQRPLPLVRAALPLSRTPHTTEAVPAWEAMTATLRQRGGVPENEVVHIGEDVTVRFFMPKRAPDRVSVGQYQVVHLGEDVTVRFFTQRGRKVDKLGPNRLNNTNVGGDNAPSEPRTTGTKALN